jgi:hypothetical protein
MAAETIMAYNINSLLEKASDIGVGIDHLWDICLRAIAPNGADKLEIDLFRVFSCISRTMTQFGLAVQSAAVSQWDNSVAYRRPHAVPELAAMLKDMGLPGY